MGPTHVVIKRGEHGVLVTRGERLFAVPGFPLEDVRDPTGAGDTFAGGFLGYLSSMSTPTEEHWNQAIIAGSAMASFSVQDVGLGALLNLTPTEVGKRFQDFKSLTHFEAL